MSDNLTVPRTADRATQPFPVRAGRAIARRWAAWFGLGLGLLSIDGLQNGVELGIALALAAFGYLLVAVVGRPAITWPAVLGFGVVVVLLRAVGISPTPVFAIAGAALAVAVVVAGRLRADLLHLLQAPAAWLFGGAALIATLVSEELGSVIVAGGLIAHAGWDLVLWRARQLVVAQSFVEWCAAFDLVVGIGILVIVV
jgi:hypothetical protein